MNEASTHGVMAVHGSAVARDFVSYDRADHRAHRRVAGIAVTDFMTDHAADHAAQNDRREGGTMMTRMMMRRSIVVRPRGMTIIVVPVIAMMAVTKMPWGVPSRMPA